MWLSLPILREGNTVGNHWEAPLPIPAHSPGPIHGGGKPSERGGLQSSLIQEGKYRGIHHVMLGWRWGTLIFLPGSSNLNAKYIHSSVGRVRDVHNSFLSLNEAVTSPSKLSSCRVGTMLSAFRWMSPCDVSIILEIFWMVDLSELHIARNLAHCFSKHFGSLSLHFSLHDLLSLFLLCFSHKNCPPPCVISATAVCYKLKLSWVIATSSRMRLKRDTWACWVISCDAFNLATTHLSIPLTRNNSTSPGTWWGAPGRMVETTHAGKCSPSAHLWNLCGRGFFGIWGTRIRGS